jgi:hypothetical protein
VPQQVEGGDDGVVYLGKGSFKMKVGVRTTPPAGTPVARTVVRSMAPTPPPVSATPQRVSATPPSVSATPLPVLKTPAPVVKTPAPIVRRASGAHRRTPTPTALPPSSGAKARTLVIGGLCMIAFSCGVMCTIAVDRFWPRTRAQCVGAQPEGPGAVPAPAAADIEAGGEPVPPATTIAVTPLAAAEPVSPAAAPPVAPPGNAVPAGPAVSPAHPVRGPAAARLQAAQGRAAVRSRPARGSSPPLDTMAPSGMWVDPFAE